MSPDNLHDLDDLYQEVILDHYRRPRNNALIHDANLEGEGFNPFCGDRILFTALVDELDCIQQVGIKGEGCAISQSSASIMGELLKGRTLDDALQMLVHFKQTMQDTAIVSLENAGLSELEVLQGVKKFPIRVKCALLAWTTLQDAINVHRNRQSG